MIKEDSFKTYPLQKEHLESVAELEKEVMNHPWTLNSFVSSYKDTTIGFLVKSNEKAVGYIWGHKIEDEVEVFKIAVSKYYQRRGLGDLLMKTFIKKCLLLGVKKVYLEVSSTNLSAINLYKKQGFTENGKRKNYYSNGNDALLLVCNLQVS